MQRRHIGRPGTAVFPPDWQADHAPIIGDTLECTVQIGQPGGAPEWNAERGQTETPVVEPVYEGPASFAPLSTSDGAKIDVVDEAARLRSYEITLPVRTAGIAPGHVVRVSESADTGLSGRTLTVDTVEYADRRFSRILYATLAE